MAHPVPSSSGRSQYGPRDPGNPEHPRHNKSTQRDYLDPDSWAIHHPPHFPKEDYELDRHLTEGSQGSLHIYKKKEKADTPRHFPECVVVKSIRTNASERTASKHAAMFDFEVRALWCALHCHVPNVVPILAQLAEGGAIHGFAMPHTQRGDLWGFLQQHRRTIGGSLPSDFPQPLREMLLEKKHGNLLMLTIRMCAILEALHCLERELEIIPCDINENNILVAGENPLNPIFILADFGGGYDAIRAPLLPPAREISQSLGYTPPEAAGYRMDEVRRVWVIEKKEYNPGLSSVYSVACIFLRLWGLSFWSDENTAIVDQERAGHEPRIKATTENFLRIHESGMTEKLGPVLEAMLDHNPIRRPRPREADIRLQTWLDPTHDHARHNEERREIWAKYLNGVGHFDHDLSSPEEEAAASGSQPSASERKASPGKNDDDERQHPPRPHHPRGKEE